MPVASDMSRNRELEWRCFLKTKESPELARRQSAPPLGVSLVLNAECYADPTVYESLLQPFHYAVAEEMLNNPGVTLISPKDTAEARQMSALQFLQYEDRRWPLDDVESRFRVFALASRLADSPFPNAIPVYLRDSVAPLFFKTFPQGQLWYVRHDEVLWRQCLDRQLRFRNEQRGAGRPVRPPAIGQNVQPFSNLAPDILPYVALLWLTTTMFPYVLFAIAPVMSGFFLLFPSPMPSYDGWGDTFTLRSVIEQSLGGVYGDRREPTTSQRVCVPAGALSTELVCEYAGWWLRMVGRRWERVVKSRSDRTFVIAGLTLNRLLVEATLVNTGFTHFQRKMMFFQVLDKAAALISAARGGVGQHAEVEVWQELVSRTFIRTRLLPFVKTVPGAGAILERVLDRSLDSLRFDKLTPRVLRAYRNSAHGYNIRQADVLFRHDEQIDNDLPDLATPLVLYLVASRGLDGLNGVALP